MGKGDKRSKRGKIHIGTAGVSRPRRKKAPAKKTAEKSAEPKKAPAKKASAKKAAKKAE